MRQDRPDTSHLTPGSITQCTAGCARPGRRDNRRILPQDNAWDAPTGADTGHRGAVQDTTAVTDTHCPDSGRRHSPHFPRTSSHCPCLPYCVSPRHADKGCPHANTCSGLWTLGTPPWTPPVRPCLRPSVPPEGPADSTAGASGRLRSQHPPPHQLSRITKEEEVPPERFPSGLFLNKNVWLLCNQCWKGRWGYL